jgi:hypothetical protein
VCGSNTTNEIALFTLRSFSNMFDTDVFEGFGLSEDEVSDFKKNHTGFCRIDMNRISGLLLIQLTAISKYRIYNSFSVTDVIQELEGVGRGCKPRFNKFRHPPMNKFFKAHFFDARFLARNLINHWGLEFSNSPKLGNLLTRLEQTSENNWQGKVAHEMVLGGYEERARKSKLTGEWIIFAKHNGLNYYLCICQHSKSPQDDGQIYGFLKQLCAREYPFLLPDEPPQPA